MNAPAARHAIPLPEMHFLCALTLQAIFDVPIYVSVVFTQRTTWYYTDLPCPTQVFDLVYRSTMPNLFVGTLTTPKRSQEFGVALNGFYINFVSLKQSVEKHGRPDPRD
jgi:hypothetical protein